MEKYIAFGLYRKNELGGHTATGTPRREGEHVYLASDVDALLEAIQKELGTHDKYEPGDAARVLAGIKELMETGSHG